MSKSKSLSSKVLVNMVSIFASRVFGLARDIACSSYWGATEGPQAAFNTAFAIPNMLRMLFGEGAFNAAFVPMIAGKLNISAEDIMFDRTDRGKPFAVGLPVEFSLSHSFQLVLCALSDRPVGADIEMTRRISQKLVNYVCTDRELHYLSSAAESDVYNRRFLEVWTAKEAYFKRLGTGITSLKDICVLDDLFRRDLTFFREGDYTVSILSELPCVRVESPFVHSEGGND